MENTWIIIALLVVVGTALIAIDFYLPGFVLGSVGIVLMLTALVLCYNTSHLGWTVSLLLVEIGIGGVAAFVSIKMFPNTAVGRRMILSHEQRAMRASSEPAGDLVGCEGVAQTLLRPSGTAILNGKRFDVVAESDVIDRGSRIKVVAVDRTRIIVQKI
jgi:membrane-bound serine protease (ClpP class)